MEPFSYEVLSDNLIHINIGDLDSPEEVRHLGELRGRVAREVKSMNAKAGEKVLSLADVSAVEGYTPEAFSEMVAFLKDTFPYVEKTATYGGNQYITIAQEAVAALSGRENMKGFKTMEEARAWLFEGRAG